MDFKNVSARPNGSFCRACGVRLASTYYIGEEVRFALGNCPHHPLPTEPHRRKEALDTWKALYQQGLAPTPPPREKYYVIVDGEEQRENSDFLQEAKRIGEQAFISRLTSFVNQEIYMTFVEDAPKRWVYQVASSPLSPAVQANGPIEVKISLKNGDIERSISFSTQVELEEKKMLVRIADGNKEKMADTVGEAICIVANWYRYLEDDPKYVGANIPDFWSVLHSMFGKKVPTVYDLQCAIREWEKKIVAENQEVFPDGKWPLSGLSVSEER